MFYGGPVLFTTAMGLGTSEVILYPHLTARYGTGWLGLVILALFFQTVWGMELSRWVVVSGEHAIQGNARIISRPGALIFILLFMFVGLAIPVWATTAAAALWEILKWPGDIKAGSVVWGIITFLFVFGLIFFSRVARKWGEIISNITLLVAWIILVIATISIISKENIRHIMEGLGSLTIPAEIDLWILASTITWVGTGPGLITYTYWLRDAGWGMARYSDPIPGWFGQTQRYRTSGILPDEVSVENIQNLTAWIRRSHGTIWIGYFLGSLVTILIFVGLSDAILRPKGLAPEGFEVVRYQANFFIPVCGVMGASLFWVMAWLLFFNTQVGISEGLMRQNADATTTLLGIPIKKSYFIWWAIYLPISFLLTILLVYYKDLTIFKYITYAAMISAGALVISMAATFFGILLLYRQLPSEIRKAVRPSPVWAIILALGVLYHLYWIVRAIIFKIQS